MRFYKCDGSCKINQEDCEFGWWFCDISVEENVADLDNGNLISEQNNVEESIDLTYPFECNKKLKFEKHEPFVKIHVPVRVHKSQMNPEGFVKKDELNPLGVAEIFCSESEDLKFLKLINFDFIKSKLLNMISSKTLEEKLLTSLIDGSKFKDFSGENYELQECSTEKSLQNESFPSKRNINRHVCRNLEKLNFTPLDSLKNTKTENYKNRIFEAIELLQENVAKIKVNIREMQMELISIRMDFQVCTPTFNLKTFEYYKGKRIFKLLG